MPIHVQKLPNEPIIILTYIEPCIPNKDMPPALAQVASYLNGGPSLTYVINDLMNAKMDLGSMILSMAENARGGPGSPADPRTRHALVSAARIVQIIKSALGQDQHGQTNLEVYPTLSEALTAVRQRIAQAQ